MGRPARPPTIDELNARFDARVHLTDGCWTWGGATNGTYGQFRVYRSIVFAHRYAYERWVGPIPEGLTIDHLCRNALCVNPAHLEPVTVLENLRRVPRRTHCVNGHVLAGNVYISRRGRRCKTCQREATRRWEQRRQEGVA